MFLILNHNVMIKVDYIGFKYYIGNRRQLSPMKKCDIMA